MFLVVYILCHFEGVHVRYLLMPFNNATVVIMYLNLSLVASNKSGVSEDSLREFSMMFK